MARPSGIITRPVTFGPAFELEDGDTAGMQVTFKATRPGVLWMETGSPAVSVAITRNADDGAEQTVDLPVTDQDGWGDGDGNAIIPGDDGHVFLYVVTVIFTQDGRTIPGSQPRSKVVPIPQGDLSPLDLDKLIPLTTPGGSVVSVPDIWSEQIAQAEAAALAAAGSLVDSSEFVRAQVATGPAADVITTKIPTVAAPPRARAGSGNLSPALHVNVKDFGALGDGVQDDTAAIKAAIAAAGTGAVTFPRGTYLLASTIALTTAVSLVGEGAGTADSASSALTTIKYTGTTGEMLTYLKVYGAKVSGIRLDGNGKATHGINADRLRNSVVEDVVIAGCTSVGLRITTNGTALHENSMFNKVRNLHVSGSPIGIVLDGDVANLCNSCHNTLDRVSISYTGAYGLLFGNADNNTVIGLLTTRASGTGVGIGFVGDAAAADGQLARCNYLYHVQGVIYARAGSKDNVAFGYDQENSQTEPIVEPGAILTWLGNAGAVQQRVWNIPAYLAAPNISQRNGFTNGGFDVWTYGATFTNPAANTRFAPRWLFWCNGTVTGAITREAFTKGQTDVPGSPRSYTKLALTGGTSTALAITASIEGADTYSDGRVEKDGQRYVRVAFWAKWDGAGPASVLSTLKQNFGTGGSPSATVSTAAGNAALTATWKQFSFFVALPSVAGKTFGTSGDDALALELTLPLSVGELSIAQFKIEPGTQHSRYIRRDLAEEEHLCSRYVQSVTAQVGTTDTVIAVRPMAKNPTVTGGGGGFTVNGISPSYIRCFQTAAAMQTLLLRAE